MCGRLNVTDDPRVIVLCEHLGVKLSITPNPDLRPTHQVAAVTNTGAQSCHWGIKPAWSKKLLINARAEMLASSKLWKSAFAHHRCLVPCNGWYEWRKDDTGTKEKFLFTASDKDLILMAGLYWPPGIFSEEATLVTLTTEPNLYCSWYHDRMPVVIPLESASLWLNGTADELAPLLFPAPERSVVAAAC
tara:strand:+ start:184 stop:753 length:570 start_codon:yes stop_codon:yes gene_type:complete